MLDFEFVATRLAGDMDEQGQRREISQIFDILRAMGQADQAVSWFERPMEQLGGKTPLAYVAEGRGQDLIGRLLCMASGNLGG